ncbi:MAG: hypothetical protein R3B48_22915 [Kofleriaceae bacterium]
MSLHERSPTFPRTAKLARVVEAAWRRPFYQRHWRAAGIPDLMAARVLIAEGRLHEFPSLRKSDLRDHLDDLIDFTTAVDVFSSSGTTGRPVDIPILADEEPVRVEGVRRVLRELGVGPGTRVLQLLSLNDLFALGPLAWLAAKAEGACVVRCSPGRTDRLLQVLEHHRPDVVLGNPYAMIRAAETASAWPPPHLPRRAFLAVAATFDRELQPMPVTRRVAELWGVTTWLNHYGSSELGPVGFECLHHRGLHVHDDVQHVELVDPRTGAALDDPRGEGELVVTGLSLPRGFIPVRYATGDIIAGIDHRPCPCGRTSPRIGPVVGRINQQLKLRGQTLFPELLLELADRCAGVARAAVQVRLGALAEDDVTLLVVPAPERAAEEILEDVRASLQRSLAVSPAVVQIAPEALAGLEERAARGSNLVKLPRVFDLRDEVAP